MADINLDEFNEKSIDIMADILDPYFELMKDKKFVALFMSNYKEAIKYACKNHKKETIEIAAILSGKEVEEYIVNPFATPLTLMSALATYSKINKDLFTSQAQNQEDASSGSATENTEASEQQNDS